MSRHNVPTWVRAMILCIHLYMHENILTLLSIMDLTYILCFTDLVIFLSPSMDSHHSTWHLHILDKSLSTPPSLCQASVSCLLTTLVVKHDI